MAELVWEAASKQAHELRKSLGLSTPVDVYEICNKLGISVYLAPLEKGVSGVISKKENESPEIALAMYDNPQRKKFTLAHEIGHYIERSEIAEDEDFSFIDARGKKYDLHEFFADEFAAALMMPESEIKNMYRNGKSTFAMTTHFGTSAAAVRKRIQNLSKRGRL